LRLRPYATLAFRDARLNNYYYGVRPDEVTVQRPAYAPGGTVNVELGLLATYRLSQGWQLLGSLGVTQASSGVGASPVVEDDTLPHAMLGLLYGFTPERAPPGERVPLIIRAYYGASSECDLATIISVQCTATHTHDNTNVAAVELGRRLVERLNDWPLDLAGFVGLLRHYERGLQSDFWQIQGYFKLYYYGFPWHDWLRTRVGFGTGLSYASRIPVSEQRDQAARNGDTSKLLLYADPTVDLNLGDLLRAHPLRDTYVGLGVSHRSGLFGWSRLFNNVFGGSNYIYAYLETSL
jgi:outer membrane protein